MLRRGVAASQKKGGKTPRRYNTVHNNS